MRDRRVTPVGWLMALTAALRLFQLARLHPIVWDEVLYFRCTDWVRRGGASLDRPTHFEVRDGKF